MRKLILALLALIATPAFASPSTFALSGWTAAAGQPERFTITRTSGNGGVYVTLKTTDGTAHAGPDYAATNVTVHFGRYQKSSALSVATFVNQAALGHTLNFNATISVNGAVVSSAGASIVEPAAPAPPPPAPTPVPAPAPVPAPVPPPPVPVAGYVPSPSLAGMVATTAPDFVLSSAVQIGGNALPSSAAPDVVGAFRFICTAGQVLADDPIVYPGQPGASHLHQFYGNTAADAYSTYDSLRAKGTSSCQPGIASPANRSSYWMPAMLDGAGNVVKPVFDSIYYKRRPITDPKCSLTSGDLQAEGNCLPIPNGIRFIFGHDMLTGETPTGSLWFNCQSPNALSPIPGVVPGHYANLTVALANCPLGAWVGAVIEAPECWDGKNLDSPNHRDHVSYPSYGTWGYRKCPDGFPYVIPTFTLGAWYPVAVGMHFSSDAMVAGAEPGSTFHADYFEGWDPTVKAMWEDNCIDKMLNCSAGDLGNGDRLIGAAI